MKLCRYNEFQREAAKWDAIFHEEFIKEPDKARCLKFLKGLLKDQPYVEMALARKQ